MDSYVTNTSVNPYVIAKMSQNIQLLDEEVAALESTGTLIRNKANLILQWPWENGIALAHGSMAEFLKGAPQESKVHAGVRELVMVCNSQCYFITLTDHYYNPTNRSLLMLSTHSTLTLPSNSLIVQCYGNILTPSILPLLRPLLQIH